MDDAATSLLLLNVKNACKLKCTDQTLWQNVFAGDQWSDDILFYKQIQSYDLREIIIFLHICKSVSIQVYAHLFNKLQKQNQSQFFRSEY